MPNYTVTADTDQDEVIEDKVGTDAADKSAYVQKVFDNTTNDQVDAKYVNWFKSFTLAEKKVIYDANQ